MQKEIQLTRAEEDVMQILWSLQKAFVKDILQEFPEPKPAYNTVSTIIRILEKKKLVGYESFGKAHRYFPLISKEQYTDLELGRLKSNYFSDSYKSMISFFIRENKMDMKDFEEILKDLKKKEA